MRSAAATEADRHAPSAGVGLRLPHLAEVAAGVSGAAWLEAHPENFLANPHARELLLATAEHTAISLHSVGLSVGSATGIDREHLAHIAALADDVDATLVSGHLAWSTHRRTYLNDLLPLPYDEESLRVVCSHVQQVQDALGRPYVLENPASYVGFATSTMTEVDFLTELVARTGCALLCDVSNVYLSAANMGYDAHAYIREFPRHAVVELHLGGFTAEPDESRHGAKLLIDTHAAAIAAPTWELYAEALQCFGPKPTLIEWDNELPPFARLLDEAVVADRLAAVVLNEGGIHAVAR